MLADGQATQADISSRLLHKPLYLRGCWAEENLQFDAANKPAKSYPPVGFTTSGIDITRAHLKNNVLHLEGGRVALRFDKSGKMTRVPIIYNAVLHVTLDIAAPPDGNFAPALDAIFAETLTDVPLAHASAWQHFGAGRWLPPVDTPAPKPVGTDPQEALPVGGSVQPPRVLKQVDPIFSNVARAMHYSGEVRISLQVDSDGTPSHLEVDRPTGMGLDERALAAVNSYRFQPATQNGHPVPVEIFVDVKFNIF